MAKTILPQQELMNYATSKELSNTLSLVFQEMLASESYSDLNPTDKKKILFHWELLQRFLSQIKPPENLEIFNN